MKKENEIIVMKNDIKNDNSVYVDFDEDGSMMILYIPFFALPMGYYGIIGTVW